MIRRLLPAVLVAVVAASAGCSVGTRAPRTPAFLTEVEPIARDVNDAIADMRSVIDRSYEAEYVYVNAVVDVRLGTRIAVGRDRLGRLEPDESMAGDAAAYDALLTRLQELATTIDGAMVSPTDRSAAATAAAELELEAARTFAALTPQACRFTSFDFSLCADDAFFTPPERAAHQALEEAAAVFTARSVIPRSLGSADLDTVTTAALDDIGDTLRDAAAVIAGADPTDTRLQTLSASLADLADATDEIGSTSFTAGGVNDGFDEMRERICAIEADFPPPEPLTGEGGATVTVAGFAEVWFVYAGRCER